MFGTLEFRARLIKRRSTSDVFFSAPMFSAWRTKSVATASSDCHDRGLFYC